MRKDAFEHSRPISSAPYPAKTAQITSSAKSVAPLLASLPPSVSLAQKSSYTVQATLLHFPCLSAMEFS